MKSLSAYHFFIKHAGYTYDPQTQTRMQGRIQTAQRLARAERLAHDSDCTFTWDIDQDMDSSDWTDELPSWSTWNCIARDADGNVFASLCGVDFGRDGSPDCDAYARVVEAELACELAS
jgi:hypothetical protein